MKIKFFISSAFLLFICLSAKAQPDKMSPEVRQRIESQRIGFITERVHLTPDEATKFWPIYNEYREALKNMREDFERPDLENISDEEATKVIEQGLQMEQKKLDLQKNLVTRLHNVISPRKILLLRAAEMEFNRELLRKAQEFRKQDQPENKKY
jgi:hypothetical protein